MFMLSDPHLLLLSCPVTSWKVVMKNGLFPCVSNLEDHTYDWKECMKRGVVSKALHWKQKIVYLATQFVVTGGTISCHYDNLWYHHWRQSRQIYDLMFSVCKKAIEIEGVVMATALSWLGLFKGVTLTTFNAFNDDKAVALTHSLPQCKYMAVPLPQCQFPH